MTSRNEAKLAVIDAAGDSEQGREMAARYISEFEHQEGRRGWLDHFASAEEAAADFRLFAYNDLAGSAEEAALLIEIDGRDGCSIAYRLARTEG